MTSQTTRPEMERSTRLSRTNPVPETMPKSLPSKKGEQSVQRETQESPASRPILELSRHVSAIPECTARPLRPLATCLAWPPSAAPYPGSPARRSECISSKLAAFQPSSNSRFLFSFPREAGTRSPRPRPLSPSARPVRAGFSEFDLRNAIRST